MIAHADSKVEKTPKPVLCSSPDDVNINLRQKVGEPNTKFIPYGPIYTAFDHPRFSSGQYQKKCPKPCWPKEARKPGLSTRQANVISH
jgi:hypothetical protein